MLSTPGQWIMKAVQILLHDPYWTSFRFRGSRETRVVEQIQA